MNYKELIFTLLSKEDYQADLLIDALSQIGFDTFEETGTGFKAYIADVKFNQNELNNALEGFKEMFSFSFDENLILHQNWNEIWESNFEPLRISDQCYIRATFHQPKPEYPYEIVIDPKMAFGTGHHQTTAMMMELMLDESFNGKQVLDMGCGTGILAILASKLGAKNILAIDNDEVCYESTLENAELNNVNNIQVLCGSKDIIPNQTVDIILANINRNILLDQLERYEEVLADNGVIFLSGFYHDIDLEMITQKAETLGLKYIKHKKTQDWVAAKFFKDL